jgi:hypothetical protein
VIVLDEFGDEQAKMTLAKWHDMAQALGHDREHEALRVAAARRSAEGRALRSAPCRPRSRRASTRCTLRDRAEASRRRSGSRSEVPWASSRAPASYAIEVSRKTRAALFGANDGRA